MSDRCPELLKASEEAEKRRDYAEALSILDTALNEKFITPEVYYARGRVLREAGRISEALESFEEAYKLAGAPEDSFKGNRLLNEIEITRGETSLRSKPRGLGVVLTTRCNLRCIMCNSYKEKWDLPKKTAREIIELLPYLERVIWLGGEVFLSEYFEELFDESLKNPNLHQTVVTDGLLIDKGWAKKLSKANLNLTYSIDSAVPEIYESIRRGGKFSEILRSARMINKEKANSESRMKTSINCTVMKCNYRDLSSLADFAIETGFDDLTLTPVDYIETEENIFLHKNAEALKFLSEETPEIEKKLRTAGLEFHNWLPGLTPSDDTGEGEAVESEKVSPRIPDYLCYWPWQHIFVDLGGRVKPHCLCSEKVGNVRADSILRIWNNDKMREYRKRIIEKNYSGICNQVCLNSSIERESMGLSF